MDAKSAYKLAWSAIRSVDGTDDYSEMVWSVLPLVGKQIFIAAEHALTVRSRTPEEMCKRKKRVMEAELRNRKSERKIDELAKRLGVPRDEIPF